MTRSRTDTNEYIARMAKFGYVTKGVTYLLLAFMVWRAADTDGRPATTRRAMGAIDNGALGGKAVLLAIAAGLFGYALWKLYIALRNPEPCGWVKRVGALFIAAINAGLGAQAFLLAFDWSHGVSGKDQAVHWSAVVMRYPMGIWAVGITGICIAGYGLRQIYRGITSDLDSKIRMHRMHAHRRRWAILVSRVGIAARGFVFTLIGVFLTRSAMRADPSQARDFGDSIQEIEMTPHGHWLLIAIAAGLLAYAIYEFIRARYRAIPTA